MPITKRSANDSTSDDRWLTLAFRQWGYLAADLDPFGRLLPFQHPHIAEASGELADRLRAVYCGPIGAEFAHIPDAARSDWVAQRMESPAPPPDRTRILKRLAQATLFELFIHARYVGTKRYSLEGATALITLLDSIFDDAAERGTEIVLIGMSHRGRLNVMAHIVGTPLADIFAGFQDVEPESVFGGGDVTYHQGATGTYTTPSGRELRVHLVSNPSHLEAVDPVVMGRARARQERIGDAGRAKVLSITLHGDAAFAGQGIAAETLNLAELRGMTVGGTIHIVVNNLIGFTTDPVSLHSSRYSTDVAKRLPIPILHVRGEDPEAVARAGEIAHAYRAEFGTDVVVDLIGYRRYGHSEVDDPTVTQPLLYRQLKEWPDLWHAYAARIGVSAEECAAIEREINAGLAQELERGRAAEKRPLIRTLPDHWAAYSGGRYNPSLEIDTGVGAARLTEIAARITSVPERFTIHPKVGKGLAERREMAEGRKPIDWGAAEALAFGSLLWDGILVRLSGQDSRRGTFNHRHAVLFDYETGAEHIPLRHLHAQQGRFHVYNSPLSEASALGFEYGFSRDYPEALVLWEAQFGDFVNGAQIIIDQFITASEAKWGLLSGLVMLLPHGYEGQGPEHSSARFERFLQLAGRDNIQVCQPTTSAQHFHLLRRQVLRTWRKPLVVLTPKSMLRAVPTFSPLDALTEGRFRPVIGDDEAADVDRVLVCSGRIAYDLRAARKKRQDSRTAIVRIEQLVPFPDAALREELARFPDAREIVWVQDEPSNMGALSFVRPRLDRVAGERRVATVKRPESASPATGSAKAHAIEQQALLDAAFTRVGAGAR